MVGGSMKKITLYKENKTDAEYNMDFRDLSNLFVISEYYKGFHDGTHNLSQALSLFIASKDGLNSTYDVEGDNNYAELLEFVLNDTSSTGITASMLAMHFGNTYEAMRQLKRKHEAGKGGLWLVYVKAYKWDKSQEADEVAK